MRKIAILTLAILVVSCSSKPTVDELINEKNTVELQKLKSALQTDLAKIDATLSKLDPTKAEEALVAVTTINDTIFNHYLEVQGNVETKDNVLIQPEMPGNLVALNVKAGQRVTKGQVLGRVDDSGMSQQLASIENQYNLAKTTFERQKNLWDKKIGSEIQFLQAQTQMVGAQKGVLQMKAQIAKTVIRAPFTGVIDEVFVARGEVVAPSMQGLMRIVNLSNMFVTTTVPESYIGKVKVGSTVNVRLESLGKTYPGKVRQVASNINPTNRSFGIEVSVPNPDNLLRPNQVAKLQIIDFSQKNTIVVPTNIIQEDGEKNKYVYIVDAATEKTGIAKKVIVKTGQSSGNVTQILSGLSSKNIVVTEGINAISEGTKLNF